MSVYTTEVRYICEACAGLLENTGYNDIDEVLGKSWNKIFKDFPIFDESYREYLCKKILNHYYTREICAETVSLWKFWLNQKMNEIMPYYNKLYLTEQLHYDPFNEVDLVRTITEKTDGNRSSNRNADGETNSNAVETHSGSTETTETDRDTSNTTNSTSGVVQSENSATTLGTVTVSSNDSKQDLHSDTPQGSIQNIKENGYLTDAVLSSGESSQTTATDSTTTSTGNNTTTTNSTGETKTESNKSGTSKTADNNTRTDKTTNTNKEAFNENSTGNRTTTESLKGKQSSISYSSLISEYRETLLNIDMDVIFELRDLFMNIY